MMEKYSTNFFILDTFFLESPKLDEIIQRKLNTNELDRYKDCIALIDLRGNIKYSNLQFQLNKHLISDVICEDDFKSNIEFYPITIKKGYLVRYSKVFIDNQHLSLHIFQSIDELYHGIERDSFHQLIDILLFLLKEKFENDLLLDNLHDLVTISDRNGYIVRANSHVVEKFGLSKEEIKGKDTKDLVMSGIITNSVTQNVLKEKTKIIMTQDTKNGRCLTVTGYPIFDSEGDIYRVVNISRDITELTGLEKKLEESEQIMHEFEKQFKRLQGKLKSSNLLITSSLKMREALEMIKSITDIDSTVLIEGETGVGKGVLAKTIHMTSNRNNYPFIKINCASIPPSLFESELFGYEKGSFTGALGTGKSGLVLQANHGTLFLDEIGELPLAMQAKILDLIQSKSFYPVGSAKEKNVDVRIIAATNKNLKSRILTGEFREDLYYRLAVIPIYVPPLRERKDEIPVIVQDMLLVYNNKFKKTKHISRDTIKIFESYDWPGNIRELENLIERLVATISDNLITPNSLPYEILHHTPSLENSIKIVVNNIIPLESAYEMLEKALFEKAIEQSINNSQLANKLNVHRTTVIRKMDKYKKELDKD